MRFYSKIYWREKNPFSEQDFLFEIKDFTPELGRPFSYNGKVYSPSWICTSQDKACVAQIVIDDEAEECLWEDNIKCPCCVYEDEDSFEVEDEDDSYKCPHCGAILQTTRNCEITYSTTVLKRPDIARVENKQRRC